MEAKDFELPIEGSMSKLTLLLNQQQEEQANTVSKESIPTNKLIKSFQKNKKSISKKKK
jgi:hypothetical protein